MVLARGKSGTKKKLADIFIIFWPKKTIFPKKYYQVSNI